MQLITDPRELKAAFYLISKSGTDLVSEAIQWKTGLWNHSMLMRDSAKIVSQGWQIKEAPIDTYMKKNVRMDFFTLVDADPRAITAMNAYIYRRMAGPWYSQAYDLLGVFGQAISCPWIHMPGIDYCSEFQLAVMRAGCPFLDVKASSIIMNQSQTSNPQDLHDMYVKNPDIFNYVGMYESDEGVIV